MPQSRADVFWEERVDAVIGTHPHVLQPFELQTDGSGHEMLLYYSIGNFLSAQPQKSCEKGGMAHFTVSVTENGCKVTETDGSGHEMLLYYSIGNFLSAQPQKSCEKGGMAHFTVSVTENGCKVTDYGLTPLRIEWEEGGKFVTKPGKFVTKPKTNEGNGVWIQNKLFSVW